MKNKPIVFAGCLLLAACSSTPVLEPYITQSVIHSDSSGMATIWADNSQLSYMLINKVDGKRTPSNISERFRYSVGVSPGAHTLSIHLSDLSDFNPFLHGGKYSDLELQVDVAAGHSYALRYHTDGTRVQAYLTDLGAGLRCHYQIAGSMRQGYVPVELKCD